MSIETRTGDIAEFDTSKGLGYVQLVDKRPRSGGEMVRIFKRIFVARPASAKELEQEEAYFAFTFFSESVKRKHLRIIFHSPFVEELPPIRCRGAIAKGGKVVSWIIRDRDGSDQIVKELAPEQEKLPIGSIWGFPFLVKRLEQDWTPETAEKFRLEAARQLELERARKGPTAEKKPNCSFFLYFPTIALADRAAQAIREQGYEVKTTEREDSTLVLATSTSPVDRKSLDRAESLMEKIARRFEGEYDGNEVAVG